MKFEKYIQRKEQIEKLISGERTGTPDQFAAKVSISKRMLYRYIESLNEFNRTVVYSRSEKTYRFIDDNQK